MLNENKIRNIVRESIDEITYGKARDVSRSTGDMFDSIEFDFRTFYDTVHKFYAYGEDKNNPYLYKIMFHANEIKKIIDKKAKQARELDDKLLDVNDRGYYAENPDGYIGDVEMRDLEKY